jgi:hypothetical protein
MKGRTRRRRSIWLRLSFAVAMSIALHALGGSAKAATVGDSSAAPGVVLAGFTSQQYPVFFRISANNRVLLASGIAISAACTDGSNYVVPDLALRVPIGADGRLHRLVITPPTAGPNGGTYSGSDMLTGMLGLAHSRLTGTWRLRVQVTEPGGESLECDSGPVRFSATS